MRRRSGRAVLIWVLLAIAWPAASGCHSVSYRARIPAGSFDEAPIDNNAAASTVRWSAVWGAFPYQWAPSGCASEPVDGVCNDPLPICDGNGAGKVETETPWYAFPISVVTLGFLMPVELTLYCRTDVPPDSGL